MNLVRVIAGIIMMWSSTVWGATVTWTASSEPDLAGYRVYQCSLQPCTLSSANASLLVTLGTVTSFNIGTPSNTQYYFVTAQDFANNASAESNLATFTPAGTPPPPPPPAASLKVVGDPATGPWGVEGSTTDLRDVMATVRLDGVVHHTENNTPYGFPNDNGTTATTGLFGTGSHTVEFVFYLQGTTTEIGRASVTVQEGSPPPPPPVDPPAIEASPTIFSFTAPQGGANPATQTLTISNTGDGTLSWTASRPTNAPWLTLSPASGTGNGAVTLTVTTGALVARSYSATVILNATGADPVTVPVTFTVATASVPPAIGVSPTSLSFTARRGGSDPATQTLSISNTGSGTLNWTAVDNAPWLALLTLLGQASGTGNAVVTVSVSTGSLAVGTYTGSITISAAGATSVTVPVTLNIRRQRNR